MSKKVAFYTLGCKLNFSETSTISRMFEQKGFAKVDFSDTPDIFIINTCSVTDNADKKCRKIVREAQDISPNGFIAIIGCYAQLKPKEISEIPGVDAVLGAAEKFQLLDLLDGFTKQENPAVFASDIKETKSFVSGYSISDRTRTFLKVQDGCNYNCSFCTIPLARGKSRSGEINDVIENAEKIAGTDVKEIVLTGVNLGDFGIVDGKRKYKFYDLLPQLDQIEGIERYRISSIEPNLLTDEIISFVARSNKFVPHFHIPLQSGSDELLATMHRTYRTDLYTHRIQKIKELMPHCAIGVDVIVGFPGETEEEFLKTYNYLNELPVSYLHVFTYSERANTTAVNMEGVVPMKERNRRSKMLRSLSHKKKRQFYESQIGSTRTVLFEQDVKGGEMFGYTNNYLRVKAKYDPLLINELKEVKIMGIDAQGFAEVSEPDVVYA